MTRSEIRRLSESFANLRRLMSCVAVLPDSLRRHIVRSFAKLNRPILSSPRSDRRCYLRGQILRRAMPSICLQPTLRAKLLADHLFLRSRRPRTSPPRALQRSRARNTGSFWRDRIIPETSRLISRQSVNAIWLDTHHRFALDSHLTYVSGFSGRRPGRRSDGSELSAMPDRWGDRARCRLSHQPGRGEG